MADAIVSAVAEQLIDLIAEQARFEINLVRGAEKEVHQLADELKAIRHVLDDAENRRFKDDMVNYWLSRLEQTSHEMEDVLDEWNYAILKLDIEQHRSDDVVVAPTPPKKNLVTSFIPSSSCLCFKKVILRHDIAKKILHVKAKLDQVLKEKDQYNFVRSQPTAETVHKSFRDPSTSFTDLVQIQGRDSDRDILVTKLTGRQEELGSIQVVSIVGVGGLGKTTLAQLVYGDSLVEKFFDLRIWVCVSNPFNLPVIAKGIIESIEKGDSSSTNNLETLLQSVRDSIKGKKFLLVLDDVWTEDSAKWDHLKTSLNCGGAGSKILMTTRNEKVAKITGTMDNDIHHPGVLSNEDCWLLLRSIALSGRSDVEFEEIGKKIAEKCNGLPLAAKTLGSLLRFKNTLEEWKSILDSELWKLEKVKTVLFPHLFLSYNELSPTLKLCFSYCAVFPKDFEINVDNLIRNWMTLGYLGSDIGNMELKGRECFDILAMCSLFQDFKKDDLDEKIESCRMHDIIHDFAQFLRKSGKVEASGMNKTTCQTCDPLLVSNVNKFCTLFLEYEESPLNLCYCLKRLRVLSLENNGLKSLVVQQGMQNMIHLRWLKLNGTGQLSLVALKIIFQLYNLQTLCLEDCNLEEIPMEVKNLIYLTHFDLSSNESLKELPREIGDLIQLRHLILSDNKSLKELPREIGNLIHLTHLNLRRNKSLKELPKEIGNLIQLRYLESSNVSLTELPMEVKNLIHLTHLDLSSNKSLKKLPREIGDLIQLRHLNLSDNKSLKELPREIGNLIHLTHLNLRWNKYLKELPREIGNLIHLRHLDLYGNERLKELPESICDLNLLTLDVGGCFNLWRLPKGVGQLISLRRLDEFHGGSGGNKLRSLKNLNNLRGSLRLRIRLDKDINSEEMVEDAEEAQLRNKIQIQKLDIRFKDEMDENEESSMVRMKLLHALETHPKLEELQISEYKGSQLPLGWLVSPLNQLRKLELYRHDHLTSLPPFGKLPCLEHLSISCLSGLEIVGRELLGIGRGGDMDLDTVAFPKLKELTFYDCSKWKEWEDITIQEEESAGMTLMPCLTHLKIEDCQNLTALPHGLLRKVSTLEMLDIEASTLLKEHYRDKDGSHWKSISQYNPGLQLKLSYSFEDS